MIQYKDGIFEGVANGYHDLIYVQVYIKSGKIEKIEYQHKDTPDTGGLAIQHIIEMIVDKQTVDIPRVAGARYSSIGVLEAVRKALTVAAGEITQEEARKMYIQRTDGGYSTEEKGNMNTTIYDEFEIAGLHDEKLRLKGGSVSLEQVIALLKIIPNRIFLFDSHGKLQYFNQIDDDDNYFKKIGIHIIELQPENIQEEFSNNFNALRNKEKNKVTIKNSVIWSLLNNSEEIIGYVQIWN